MIVLLDRAAAQPAPAPTSPPQVVTTAAAPQQTTSGPTPTPLGPMSATATGRLALERPQARDEVSEDGALGIALGATLASWTTMLVGLQARNGTAIVIGGVSTVILPSAGHWYAGSSGALGLGMRAIGAAGLVWSLVKEGEDNVCDEGCEPTNAQRAIGLTSLGLYLAGTIVDIATAPAAARRHNRAVREVTIGPALHRGGAGVSIAGWF